MTADEAQELILNGAPWLAGATLCLAGAVYFAELLPASERPLPPRTASSTATLVVVETESCGWCRRFRRDVEPGYGQTAYAAQAPLHFVLARDLTSTGYQVKSPVRAVPTFILVDRQGREIDRLRGYPGGAAPFYAALDGLLAKMPAE